MAINVEDVKKVVDGMAEVIIKNEVYFCDLDSVAGDGDFGMSVAKGFKQLKSEWDDLDTTDIGTFLKSAGMIITEYCGGASGPIWGTAFRSAAKYAKGKTELEVDEIPGLFEAGIAGIQKRGGAKLGDKTLLDALIPAAEAMKENSSKGLKEMFEAATKAAEEGAEATKKISAKKGRASYVGDRSLEHPDAGAMAMGVIFKELTKE